MFKKYFKIGRSQFSQLFYFVKCILKNNWRRLGKGLFLYFSLLFLLIFLLNLSAFIKIGEIYFLINKEILSINILFFIVCVPVVIILILIKIFIKIKIENWIASLSVLFMVLIFMTQNIIDAGKIENEKKKELNAFYCSILKTNQYNIMVANTIMEILGKNSENLVYLSYLTSIYINNINDVYKYLGENDGDKILNAIAGAESSNIMMNNIYYLDTANISILNDVNLKEKAFKSKNQKDDALIKNASSTKFWLGEINNKHKEKCEIGQ